MRKRLRYLKMIPFSLEFFFVLPAQPSCLQNDTMVIHIWYLLFQSPARAGRMPVLAFGSDTIRIMGYGKSRIRKPSQDHVQKIVVWMVQQIQMASWNVKPFSDAFPGDGRHGEFSVSFLTVPESNRVTIKLPLEMWGENTHLCWEFWL